MGNQTFKPRYMFAKSGKVLGVTGIRSGDFEAILDLAGRHVMRGLPEDVRNIVTHMEESNHAVLRDLRDMRSAAVHRDGLVTLKFRRNQPASDITHVFNCASVEWTTANCPDHKMWLVTDPDLLRIFRTLEILGQRLDEPRMAWVRTYSWYEGPRRGQFAPLLEMEPDHRAKRIEETRKRIAENKRWRDLIRNRLAPKPVAS